MGQSVAVDIHELPGRCPKHVRDRRGHVGAREIRRRPERDFGRADVDPHVGTQAVFHILDKQSADVVHVHVGDHHIGDGRQLDPGSLQAPRELPGTRETGELPAQSGVDQQRLLAAAHHQHVQRPIERIRAEVHILEPGGTGGRVGIGRHGRGRQRQHAIADHQHIDVANLERIARRHQLLGG